MTDTATQPVTAAAIVEALNRHFEGTVERGPSLERDTAIWICRHWTNQSTRAIAKACSCGASTVVRAERHIADVMGSDKVVEQLVLRAEDYLASEAFPLEDEDAEDADALAQWPGSQRGGDG